MGSWEPMSRPAVLFLVLVAACTAEAAPLPAATLPELTGSVRGTALGGATAALGADPGLAWSSPAAPSGAERALVALTGQRGFIDDLTWQALGSLPAGGWTFTGAAAWYDSGDATVTAPDGTTRRVSAQRELLAAAGAARPLAAWLDAGVTARLIRSELLQQLSAWAATADAGVAARLGPRVRLAAAVVHAGTDLRYDAARVRMPLGLQAGAALESPVDLAIAEERDRVRVTAQAGWRPRDRRFEWRGGVEYARPGLAALRVGAHRPPWLDRWRMTLGVGIEAGRLTVDYATWLSGAEGSPHLVGLTVKLGRPAR